MGWTEERVQELKKLWAEGHSASQIAKKLGSVTRNAVIGKVHRLGLSGRATPSRPVKRPPRLARPKPQQVATAPRSAAAPLPSRTQLAVELREPVEYEAGPVVPAYIEPKRLPNGDMVTVLTVKDSMCKWPIGDPADAAFGFCGRASCHGSPYCADHAQVAFQPAKKRERRAREMDYLHRLAG